jgi:hypothetical protein
MAEKIREATKTQPKLKTMFVKEQHHSLRVPWGLMSNITPMEQERDTNFLVASELLRKGSRGGLKRSQAAKRLIPKLHYSFSSSSLKDKIVLHLSQICASTLGNGAAMAQGL